MPKKRLSMRKIREILRLKYGCSCSNRAISRSCGIGRATVGDYLHRAKAAGLGWPLPGELSDTALEQRLFLFGFYLGQRHNCFSPVPPTGQPPRGQF